MNILTDEEIVEYCVQDFGLEDARTLESAVVEKLPSLGFVRLKPGQVVAEYKPCVLCGSNDPKAKGIYLGKPCDGHKYLKLVEVKP
jgi:hypothetical protein